ncbi:MAG TPA: LLM class F420-dependent oxidoreductase [Candidatus Xenobia bacterium]|jgi:probable F420-dependent oxidoreductase
MKRALQFMGAGPTTLPDVVAPVARLADELGYESLWAGQRVACPEPPLPPPFNFPSRSPSHDPIVALTYVASQTQRVRLGTGVLVLPFHHPAVLAKQVAGLDVLSKGRLICGIGVGYMEPEFRTLGVPFRERGRRTDECLDAMQALWTMDKPAYHGQFFTIENIDAWPRPVQHPLPIVVAGKGPLAFRRAVTRGHGWYGGPLNLEQTAQCLAGLREAASQHERPSHLGRLEISVGPVPEAGVKSPDAIHRYEDLGVDRLIFWPFGPWAWPRLDGTPWVLPIPVVPDPNAMTAAVMALPVAKLVEMASAFLHEYAPPR